MASEAIHIISNFLNPIPQYVLGCLPAIAITEGGVSRNVDIGIAMSWLSIYGVALFLNVGKDEVKLCIYWLSSKYFSSEDKKIGNYNHLNTDLSEFTLCQ